MRALIASPDAGLGSLLGDALAAQGLAAPEPVMTAEELEARQRDLPAALVLLDARAVGGPASPALVSGLRSAPGGGGSAIVVLVEPGGPSPLALLEAGADDFVELPCSSVTLAARLRVALRSAASAQAVRTLAQNEARFRTLVQHSGDLTTVFAADGRLLYASPTAERVTGRPVGSMLGLPLFDLLHADDLVPLSEHLARADTGAVIVRVRHLLGSWVHLESVFTNLLLDPNVRGMVVNSRDVTDRERAAAALRESEESLSATLRGIGEAVVATDRQEMVVRMNPVAEQLTGWSLAEARGRSLSVVAPLEGSEDGEPTLVERALRDAQPHGATSVLRRRDGTECPVAATAAPIRDFAGHVSGVVLVLRDVTDEKRAAEALQRSESSFRALIESGPEGITVERRGQLVYANLAATRLLAYKSPDEMVGLPGLDLVHADDRESVRAHNEEVLRNGAPSPPREQRFLRTDGGLVVAETITLPLDFDGAPALVHIARDVTERRLLESRLLVTDRMASVGTLAAGVAHEINNPLAGVTTNLRFLSEEMEELGRRLPEDRRSEVIGAIRDAQEGSERVRVIVRDLKAFSRGDEERRGPVDAARVLESTAHLAWNEIRHRARLVKDFQPVPPVLANEARLGQVFLNLVINAAQSIVEGEADRNEIRLATRPDGDGRVLVEVSDTGAGIQPENLKRLFDPFFTTKPVGVGTGLGLFVCQGIVISLGGEIAVESRIGQGTTFRISLPAILLPVEAIGAARATPAGRRGRVLVVDDEPMILVSVRRLLSSEHEVVAVSSARDALNLLQGGSTFDVILCDLMMPEMTGMDLHGFLRQGSPELAERMIFLTGGAFTQRARTFLDQVTNRRLEKPFDASALRALVRERLESPPPG